MDPFIAAVLNVASKRLAAWWLEVRPFSKETRAARKQKRELNKTLKAQGLSRKERRMKLLEILAQISASKRTSTKAGLAGFAPLLVYLPFYDEVNGYLMQACQSEEGPLVFLAGGFVVWLTMFITARRSKTPATPGVL